MVNRGSLQMAAGGERLEGLCVDDPAAELMNEQSRNCAQSDIGRVVVADFGSRLLFADESTAPRSVYVTCSCVAT